MAGSSHIEQDMKELGPGCLPMHRSDVYRSQGLGPMIGTEILLLVLLSVVILYLLYAPSF